MKSFLKKSSIFLLLLLVLNVLMFFLIKLFYIKDYEDVDLKFSSFLLADSHGTPIGDFSEEYDVHNFSGQSDSYLDMERKLKYLIRNTDVDTIYISVDDHTLSPTRENQNNLDRSAYYTTKEDYSNYFDYINDKYLKYYLIFLNDRYSLVIKNFIQEELFAFSKWGGSSSKIPWEKLTVEEQKEKSKARFENYFEKPDPSVKMSAALQNIISICEDNNIKLFGVRFPVSKVYYGILGEESYHADSLFFKNGLVVLDFDNLLLEQDSLFRDMDHLDKEGGGVFADILFDTIDSIP
ncbi:hypothetical protein Belba_1742 [Belliella baltica DSM 15883]|uniref:Uncharacterized protein n=1 Tax=Belliella baltica (strain DSM 15883 / CIP 108006 / LMG 21964 / BA134) TaxID=866536 RepID=I3Z526_BELBD|nr:hypothetical protein [Belliella baltica]AFL84344.1 hypothetical protein Belba_1742 [Belliella baltica DSM 15883]